MAFWSGETLKKNLPNLVNPHDVDEIDCAAYTLHIGSEIYVSPDYKTPDPATRTSERLDEGESFAIPPGQFGFLTTEEQVTVPDDALAFISIRARAKLGGLINISGFHVDPGYKGKLLFSVMNAGPLPLHLRQGQPLFLIWYASLDRPTQKKKDSPGFNEIDTELLRGISGRVLSPQSLSEEYREMEGRLSRHVQEQDSRVATIEARVRMIGVVASLVTTIFVGIIVALVTWAITGYAT